MGSCCYLTVKVAVVLGDLGVSSDLWEVVGVELWLVAWGMEVALQAVEQEVEVLWMEIGMAVDQRNGALPARR